MPMVGRGPGSACPTRQAAGIVHGTSRRRPRISPIQPTLWRKHRWPNVLAGSERRAPQNEARAATRGQRRQRCPRLNTSVLEEQLAVLRQRPEFVVDQRLELVGNLPQGTLGGDDLIAEDARLRLHRSGLVSLVLGMLERAD